MGRRGRLGGALLTALLLAGIALSTRVSTAGDPELARFLLQGGRDDLAKKQYEDALKKFVKATSEDPGLIEAQYWAGQVHEARKDARLALVCYRAFRDGYERKKAGGPTSKEEDALLGKVQARFDVLAASETEYRKIQTGYVSQLFSFAEENFVRDPAITVRALKMLLEAQPEHEAARKLLDRLGGPEGGDADGATDPSGVRAWTDLMAEGVFGSAEGFERGEGTLTFERRTGQVVLTAKPSRVGPKYVYEAEFRFVEEFEGKRVVGFVFAYRGDVHYAVMATPEKVDLVSMRVGDGRATNVESAGLRERLELDVEKRLAISVEGLRIEVRLDGVKVIEAEVEGRDDLEGDVGLYLQQARVEFKRLRVGRRE